MLYMRRIRTSRHGADVNKTRKKLPPERAGVALTRDADVPMKSRGFAMRLINSNRRKRAILWIAPMTLLVPTAAHAQWAPSYGYYDHDHSTRHHQRDEKRDLREHQREERWQYGESWALRRHQREERHELKHHQKNECGVGDFNGYNSPDGYYGRDSYGRRY